MERSPLEILGAIVDEVDGLRRSDAKSHLPEQLMREAREAVAVPSCVAESWSRTPNRLEDLVGRTIEHVFDSCDMLRGDALILCTDGAFVALEASDDGINEMTFYKKLGEYVSVDALLEAGAISRSEATERKRKAKEEALQRAQDALTRAQRDAEEAQDALDKLQATA